MLIFLYENKQPIYFDKSTYNYNVSLCIIQIMLWMPEKIVPKNLFGSS